MDPIMTRANGFLVTLEAEPGYYQYVHVDTLEEATAEYQEPPSGYRAIAIAACKDGRPFADLTIGPRVQIVTRESVVTT